MRVLGIETSCDETAASVVENGDTLLSNVVASSMDLHIKYGGVVPEVAARSHVDAINSVIHEALWQAKYGQGIGLSEMQGNQQNRTNRTKGTKRETRTQLTQQFAKSNSGVLSTAQKQAVATDDLWSQIDAIAVTYGAGLGGSLLVGVMAARTLAILHKKPLYACNHVEGHVYANFITKTVSPEYKTPSKQPDFPLLALIVSGGHTQLVFFKNHFDYKLLGRTRDDAIGEAFDKVAKILGLPYPGGPSISNAAQEGNPDKYTFPKSKLDAPYEFSFSGLKTAVLRTAQTEIGKDYTFPSFDIAKHLSLAQKNDLSASFQKIAIETVVDKAVLAAQEFNPKSFVIAGGVAANQELRRQLSERLPLPIQYPDIKLCTDNGAMIAALGCFKLKHDQPTADPYSLDIAPNLSM